MEARKTGAVPNPWPEVRIAGVAMDHILRLPIPIPCLFPYPKPYPKPEPEPEPQP